MGRWVTSKGRRIYIPDEGEENPYANESKKGIANRVASGDYDHEVGNTVDELTDRLQKHGLKLEAADLHDMRASSGFNDEKVTMYDEDGNEYQGTYNKYSDGGREIVNIKKTKESEKESLKKQINKDFDTKEKQITANKEQSAKLNSKEVSLEQKKQYLRDHNLTKFAKELNPSGSNEKGAVEYVYDQHTLSKEEFRKKYFGDNNKKKKK